MQPKSSLFAIAFTGAKDKPQHKQLLYPWFEDAQSICEPFAGSAAVSLSFPQIPSYLGEADLWTRSHWQAIKLAQGSDRAKSRLLASVNHWQQRLKSNLDQEWDNLKDFLHSTLYQRSNCLDISAGILAQKGAAFNNYTRCRNDGRPNVPPNKAKDFIARDYALWFVNLPSTRHVRSVLPDYRAAIAKTPKNSTIFLDPPYWVSREFGCFACYPGHKPAAEFTYQLQIDSLNHAIARGFHRIVITNYITDRLSAEITWIAAAHNLFIHFEPLGALSKGGERWKSLRHIHGARSQKKSTPIEGMWVLEPAKQLTLFRAI